MDAFIYFVLLLTFVAILLACAEWGGKLND